MCGWLAFQPYPHPHIHIKNTHTHMRKCNKHLSFLGHTGIQIVVHDLKKLTHEPGDYHMKVIIHIYSHTRPAYHHKETLKLTRFDNFPSISSYTTTDIAFGTLLL